MIYTYGFTQRSDHRHQSPSWHGD